MSTLYCVPSPKRPPLSLAELLEHSAAYRRDMGARIKSEREAQGLTQQELAAWAGLCRKQVIQVEAGKNTTTDTAARLCLALGKHPEEKGCPAGLLGATARAVAKRLKLDLRPGKK